MKPTAAFMIAGTCLVMAACQNVPTTEVEVARQNYVDYCASCHGVDGRGVATLDVPPPDLTRLSARNGGTFPLVAVMSQIDGYTRGDGAMPEFGDYLLDDRTVLVETSPGVQTPTPERLVAMARYLESLQR